MLPAVAGLLLGCASAVPERAIDAVDRALRSRDRTQVEAVIDWEGWRASGGADPAELRLELPPPPLTRVRALAEREHLYSDGEGRNWRLRLVETKSGPKVLALPRPCPPGGTRRGPIGDDARPAPSPAPSGLFTPLECWPLPK